MSSTLRMPFDGCPHRPKFDFHGAGRMYGKNDRVVFTSKGVEYLGRVVRDQQAPGSPVPVVLDNGNAGNIRPDLLSLSNAPPPISFSKGDRVEFDEDGATVHGTVVRSGASLSVVPDGGERKVSGHPSLFRATSFPAPVEEPSEMDRWGVIRYRPVPSRSPDSINFMAVVTFDGKSVLTAENDGNGGCNLYRRTKGAAAELGEAALEAAASAWSVRFGLDREPVESADDWIAWYVGFRPYGVTATAHHAKANDSRSGHSAEEAASGERFEPLTVPR